MIKRLLFIAMTLLPLAATAQYGVGDWRLHPSFVASAMQNCIDAGNEVYYLASNNLFRFDKSTSENESLNKRNYLSDITISNIYYNYDKNYVVVAYANSNLDFIMADGKVVNMPEIKDAVLTGNKQINDITFSGNSVYVATAFGYIVIDDQRMEVRESRIFNFPVFSVAQVGQWLLMAYNTNRIYYCPVADHAEQIGQYTVSNDFTAAQMHIYPVSDNKFLLYGTGTSRTVTMAEDGTGKLTFTSTEFDANAPANVQRFSNGFVMNYPSLGYYYMLGSEGNNPQKVAGGNEYYSCKPGESTIWALSASGLHRNGDTSNYYMPNGVDLAGVPFWMTYNKAQDKLYLTSTADNAFLPSVWRTAQIEINTYDGSTWANATPAGTEAITETTNGMWQPIFDPSNPNSYFFSTRRAGLVNVVDNRVHAVHTPDNSPRSKYMSANAFDSKGNLWVVQPYNDDKPVKVLPKDKLYATPSASNWIVPTVPNVKDSGFKFCHLAISKGTDIKVYSNGDYQKPVIIWSDGGNINNTSPTSRTFTSFTDQDDKSYSWANVYALTPDDNGLIWMGTGNGVVTFNPAEAFTDAFRVNHIKVPRNDGTNLADYLLDGLQVNCIAVDGANRKWIGTNSTGLFLVSADGSEIIKRFTMDNSYLPTNTIYNVCCNTNSNSVYIVTPQGVLEYFSDSSPAEPDFNNVAVYPNPVRPDFTGLLTISGLMENSLVKIADSGGNVVKQLKSTGGMVTWDCCNADGNRVPTGVYYVLASQSASGGSANAVVSKFLVVN